MKKVFLVTFLILIGIIGYFKYINSNVTVTNYPSQGKNIIVFGDSLVRGYGANPDNDFVSVLSRKLNTPVINLGKNGDTALDGLNRIDQVVQNNPKLVLVLFGGNDALQRISPDETFSNLEKIVVRIQSGGAMVALLGVPGGILNDPYASRYKALAQKYHAVYVSNILDGLIGNDAYMFDQIHPNDAGYDRIANRLSTIILPLLQ